MAETERDDLAAARAALSSAFASRVREVVDAWLAEIAADPHLRSHLLLPRHSLEDHLPDWLKGLAAAFAKPPGDARSERDQERLSGQHGEERWRQGYNLHEVTREWGALHRCLVVEVERYAAEHPDMPAQVLRDARHTLAFFVSESTSDSAQEFFELERRQASGNLRDLEHALASIREVERQQGELWRQAAHDLRGGLGVVANVTRGLGSGALPAARRDDFVAMLGRNVGSLHAILDDVTDLARLQAAQETRRVATFDAAALLRALADDVTPAAVENGLAVGTAGPAALEVEGDAVKVRRIAQNLMFNAVRYTRRGGVTLAWGQDDARDSAAASGTPGWWFSVADTGPGLAGGDAASPSQGEGLGLAIVRRLAALLDAVVEATVSTPSGTTFRVHLPARYP